MKKKESKKKNIQTLVYLLTDGAVYDTAAIIDLVKENCGPNSNTNVHTFGVGNGADEKLIKGCAYAGCGSFTFIYKPDQIERKVIESLSRTKLEYLVVTEASVLDEDDQVLAKM